SDLAGSALAEVFGHIPVGHDLPRRNGLHYVEDTFDVVVRKRHARHSNRGRPGAPPVRSGSGEGAHRRRTRRRPRRAARLRGAVAPPTAHQSHRSGHRDDHARNPRGPRRSKVSREAEQPRGEDQQHPDADEDRFTGEHARPGEGQDRGEHGGQAEEEQDDHAQTKQAVPDPAEPHHDPCCQRHPVVPLSAHHTPPVALPLWNTATRGGAELTFPTQMRGAAAVCGGPAGRPGQYLGRLGSTVSIQERIPPPTCTASEKPAFLTAASASADRPPDLQCRMICLSCGSLANASPVRNSPLGMRTAPGMLTISYSFFSRTSTRKKSSPRSIFSLSSLAVIVDPRAASWASSGTVPQNAS